MKRRFSEHLEWSRPLKLIDCLPSQAKAEAEVGLELRNAIRTTSCKIYFDLQKKKLYQAMMCDTKYVSVCNYTGGARVYDAEGMKSF